ncbi:putative salutaridinol 7-O-acetyltransferase [Helianthus annuus]|nr:putative salutaridinol 7-O-acetyltransferase [Helianthus annuus]KAJ0690870.1 putative salutaridinol 7-O-acetyltransferase [Helianthus annuus]KAJ0872529.1 putative salutaridinol 7-O-acetyltransferase [Helianthus annuus]
MKIISQETIKPSSPTPPHLKNHVLSLVDNYTPAIPVPFVFFYKNYNDGDINILKKSLSQCLTQYYPFPGRISSPSASHIECNDEGVEFLEVSHDSRLEDIIHMKEHDERLYKLLPNVGENFPNLVEVQLNHFTDGGVAVAVSILHKVADGFAIATFINQWAKVTRGGLLFEPNFFISSTNHNIVKLPDVVPNNTPEVKYVNRSFVFPNSKLNELKKKVMSSMGLAVMSPPLTRIEVLTSLIYKCSAATTKSGMI